MRRLTYAHANLMLMLDNGPFDKCFCHPQLCSLEQYITPSGYLRHKAACKDTHVSTLKCLPDRVMQLVTSLTEDPRVAYPIRVQPTNLLISTAILLLQLFREGLLSVTNESMYKKYWLSHLSRIKIFTVIILNNPVLYKRCWVVFMFIQILKESSVSKQWKT